MDKDNQILYPEHFRLHNMQGATQILGDFMIWLAENGMCIAKCNETNDLVPVKETIDRMLAKVYKIDIQKLHQEKLDMARKINELRDKYSNKMDQNK